MKRSCRISVAVVGVVLFWGGATAAHAETPRGIESDPVALLPGAPGAPTVQEPLLSSGPVRTIIVKTWSSKTAPDVDDIVAPTSAQLARAESNAKPTAAASRRARRGPLAKAAAWATDNAGCVNNISGYQPSGAYPFSLRGNMVGCGRGGLHLHTYIRYQGALWQDGSSNSCSGTSCTTADTICPCAPLGYFTLVVHGWNTNTGGSDYASVELLRYVGGASG